MSYLNHMVRDSYGVCESNPIDDTVRATREAISEQGNPTVDLVDVTRITRLRLVGDPGWPVLDLSYCYGELADGTPVRVRLPRCQFRSGRGLIGDLIDMCKSVGVYGKGIGILDPDVISVCR